MKTNLSTITDNKLSDAKQQFEDWRKHRVRGQRIPKELWSLAIDLAKVHGVSTTSKTLGLAHNCLHKKLKANGLESKRTNKPSQNPKVIRMAPLQINAEPRARASAARPSLMAELVTAAGVSVRIFSGIDPDSLKAITSLAQEV